MGKAWTSGHRDELKTLEENISLKLIFISKEIFSILYIFNVHLGGRDNNSTERAICYQKEGQIIKLFF